ncbi:MAG: heparinase II/III family protein [Acidimicrobiia bacterium]|nr:heparinase II/III family protein [Acidimicrobiia bacterium]
MRNASSEPVSALIDEFIDVLTERRDVNQQTVCVMSNGGAGCHFFGELLNEMGPFRLTDEVYYPPGLLETLERIEPAMASMALDFVDLVHAGESPHDSRNLIIVNIGHLRPDARPADLRRLGHRAHFAVLLRNPYQVAVSRALRKEEYRAAVGGDPDDDRYLAQQARYGASFLERVSRERWDSVHRYETLVRDPIAVLRDFHLSFGVEMSLDEAQAAAEKFSMNADRNESINLNDSPRSPLTASQVAILIDSLESPARQFGYMERPLAEVEEGTTSSLWLPLFARETLYSSSQYERLCRGRVQVFRSQPETELPANPTWSEDPLGSKTWRLYFHSLQWLLGWAWGIDNSESRDRALDNLFSTIRSYLESNVLTDPKDEMAWDDHSAADRLAVLSYLYHRYLREEMTSLEHGRFLEGIAVHVDRVLHFRASRRWIDSNHGVFHAAALISCGIVFRGQPLAASAFDGGVRYLDEVVQNLVEPVSGASTEQSMSYHSVNLALLREVRKFAEAHSLPLQTQLSDLCAKMVEFNHLIRCADNRRPAIGDTPYGDRIPARALRLHPDENPTPHTVFVESNGEAGTPIPNLNVLEPIGLAVFRKGENFADDASITRAFFTFASKRGHHGHFDALSLCLHLRGRDVLIDSGGPYAYGDPLRFSYFVAPRAHNTILVDGTDHTGSGSLDDYAAEGGTAWVAASHRGYEGIILRRALIELDGDAFAVVDSSNELDSVRQFTTLWHLPPGTRVETHTSESGKHALLSDGGGTRIANISFIGTNEVHLRVERGDDNGEPIGWVTTGPGKMEPAEVLMAETSATRLLSATVITSPTTRQPTVGIVGDEVRLSSTTRNIAARWSATGFALTEASESHTP